MHQSSWLPSVVTGGLVFVVMSFAPASITGVERTLLVAGVAALSSVTAIKLVGK